MALKGQQIRILIKQAGAEGQAAAIAKATGCKISCSLSTEDATTKDETSAGGVLWDKPDMGSKSWSITVDHLFAAMSQASDSTAAKTKLLTAGTTYVIEFTIGGVKFTGNAIYNQADIDAQNKQNATGSDSFTGAGALSYT